MLSPLGELASRVNELLHDQEIVVVYRSRNHSQRRRDILLKAGFTTLPAWRVDYPVTCRRPTVSGS
jgi:rhodanese-related sulfurtransferase